jgi:4-amino-4-deoxy-L-arabinose transferase-like glycosyltransferase
VIDDNLLVIHPTSEGTPKPNGGGGRPPAEVILSSVATDSTRIADAAPREGAWRRIALLTRRIPSPVLLGSFVAAVAAINVWWRLLETRPPHWDMGHHLSNSIVYLHDFSAGQIVSFVEAFHFYPPLVYWVTDIFYAVLGRQAMWVAVLSNIVWLGVLVFSIFAVGRLLWSVRVGWLSVIFVVSSPMIVSASKEYMLDLPITAVAALGLYLLIRADGFSSRRFSLFLGAVCGCGMLVKWTLPLVLALPLVHAFATALSAARLRRDYDRLLNVAWAAAAAFVIAGPWYVHNFSKVAGASLYYSGPEGALRGDPRVATPASALSYLWTLVDAQLYVIPVLLLLAGIVSCFRKHELVRRNLYPILMAVGTYVTFSLLRHKDPRYTLPMLPALAIVATSWIEYLSVRARAWITAAFASYAAIAFLAISFGTSLLPRSVIVDVPDTSFGPSGLTLFAQSGYIIGPPTHEDWHQADVFAALARFPRPERTFAYRGPDTIWFNGHGLRYYALTHDATQVDAAQARFLLERGRAHATPAGYVRLERWRLPDGGTLAVYRRIHMNDTMASK